MTAGSVAPEGGPSAARTPKGMHDVLWPESSRWETTVARFAALVQGAGYGLVLTPIVEHAGVFLRGIGEGSEVVGKEMYVFEDRDGQMMALRPEGTAPVVRAFVQHHPVPPWKAWYAAPSFRHENPQHGRYRQHYQLGVEALGPADADLDVEVVSLAHDFFAGLGLREVELRLQFHGRRGLQARLRRAAGRVPRRAGGPALPGPPGASPGEPAAGPRLQDRGVPEGHGGRAALPGPPVRPVRRSLRSGARRPGGARGALRDRPPLGPGLRLLHEDHVRVRGAGARRGAERGRRRRALRRAGRDARRRAHAGDRLRHRGGAGVAGLRRGGRVPRRRAARSTPTSSTRRAGSRR